MGGVFSSVPKAFSASKSCTTSSSSCTCNLLKQKFLKVLQPMQMDLQQVLRQKEKADQQPY
jgi:hypothetical protein